MALGLPHYIVAMIFSHWVSKHNKTAVCQRRNLPGKDIDIDIINWYRLMNVCFADQYHIGWSISVINRHTHTHTRVYIYIYIDNYEIYPTIYNIHRLYPFAYIQIYVNGYNHISISIGPWATSITQISSCSRVKYV